MENSKETTSDGAESESEEQPTPKPAPVPLLSEEEVHDLDTANAGVYDWENANADLWALAYESPTPSQRAEEEEEEEEEYVPPWSVGTHCRSRFWRAFADFDNMKTSLDAAFIQVCDVAECQCYAPRFECRAPGVHHFVMLCFLFMQIVFILEVLNCMLVFLAESTSSELCGAEIRMAPICVTHICYRVNMIERSSLQATTFPVVPLHQSYDGLPQEQYVLDIEIIPQYGLIILRTGTTICQFPTGVVPVPSSILHLRTEIQTHRS